MEEQNLKILKNLDSLDKLNYKAHKKFEDALL